MFFNSSWNIVFFFVLSGFMSFSSCVLCFFNILRCFVCFTSFSSVNFSHTFISSFYDGLFLSLYAIINLFVNSCLLLNSFHLVSNISLLLYFCCWWFFIGFCDSSHDCGVWSLSWGWSWWEYLDWDLNWIWNWSFSIICNRLSFNVVCDDFTWSLFNFFDMMVMDFLGVMVMNMVHVVVVNIIIPWVWCSSNFEHILHSSINNSLGFPCNSISLNFDCLGDSCQS